MPVCSVLGCGATDLLQDHHISYDPEIKITLCKLHHIQIHCHGVGRTVGEPYLSEIGIDTVIVGARIPAELKESLNSSYVKAFYTNMSEFVRGAIREKLLRDAPGLIVGIRNIPHISF